MIKENKKPIYLDKNKPTRERVEDLLQRMTVEEKTYQMCCLVEWDPKNIQENGKLTNKKIEQHIKKGLGNIGVLLRYFEPEEGTKLANYMQKLAIEKTRLGIPMIIHEECLHGCRAVNSTSFPQSIALASTWDDDLMSRVALTIGKETRARGIQQCLSPTINIARDARCGRTEETYGEDPHLTTHMAKAFIKGIQDQKVVATPKHFAANFVGDGGRDSNEIHFSDRILKEIYLPAFEASIKEAGALSIMAAYNSLDGIPCSSNKWLLTDVLRKEWGFKGFVVSDYWSVTHIYEKHKVATTKAEAAQKATEAGLDIELPDINCFSELEDLVKQGRLSIEVINEAVRRIIWVKFWLGLFEHPYVDPNYAEKLCDCDNHRQLALEAARKSIILLKNSKETLPLKTNIKSITVIGPNANEVRLGGYSAMPRKVITTLEGIKNKVSKNTKVYFEEGCKVIGDEKKNFSKAINAVKKSDVAILVMGNSNETEAEERDRCNLDLPGFQEDLIIEISKIGKPVIVVLINGSAITMQKWIDKVDTVIEAWYPGEEGGNAIADVIFGNYNPGGHLPITFPKVTGQLPLYYNYKPSGRVYDYADLREEQPSFPFGYGLSYTKFTYSNLKIEPRKIPIRGEVKINIEVKNAGKYKGDEIVQLYLTDIYSSVARPVKELKGYKKITLKAGEKKKVEFILTDKDLFFLDVHLEPVVEPGTFEVMVGGNSVEGIKNTFEVV